MARTTQESSKAATTKRKSTASSSSKKSAAKPADKTTVSKSATPKTAATGRRPRPAKLVQVTSQQRHALIAEAAYLRAEKRGFQGDPTEDWLMAEKEVDEKLYEHAIAS